MREQLDVVGWRDQTTPLRLRQISGVKSCGRRRDFTAVFKPPKFLFSYKIREYFILNPEQINKMKLFSPLQEKQGFIKSDKVLNLLIFQLLSEQLSVSCEDRTSVWIYDISS